MAETDDVPELSGGQRRTVLAAAFVGWMFAGFEIALFVLIHRAAMQDLLGATTEERDITLWFARYQAAFLFGAAAGGWLFGWLGDRRGRTWSLAMSVLCYSTFTGASYVAETPEQLLVLRFLACLGVGGAWPNTMALVAEAWPGASRPLLAGVLGTAANVGQVLMGGLGLMSAVAPGSWRWVLLAGAAPALIGAWCLTSVPESVRWLRARRAARSDSADPLKELLQPPLRGRLIMGVLLGAVPVIGTAANAQWIVPWSDQAAGKAAAALPGDATAGSAAARGRTAQKSKAWTIVSRSSGAVLGSLLGGLLAALLGRRTTYFLISLLSLAASTIVFGRMHPLDPGFYAASFAFGLIGVIYFGWLPLYLPELFPTRVRATGAGISFNSGRVVAAIVVLGTSSLLQAFGGDYARIGLWTGMIYALGMIIVLFAPRTDSASLGD
ncbi:MAG: MFS transporter [Planctomyces sp.]|nr:MFS transporter [Planctomyces sp.]